MKFLTRAKIAGLILLGKDSGMYGPRTICPDMTQDDGSPAYHQASWDLQIYSPSSMCGGSKPIPEHVKHPEILEAARKNAEVRMKTLRCDRGLWIVEAEDGRILVSEDGCNFEVQDFPTTTVKPSLLRTAKQWLESQKQAVSSPE